METGRRPWDQVLSWDNYIMGVALLTSLRSKDPNTQVGACIVGGENEVISLGYNGFPRGCSDSLFSWKKNSGLDNKHNYVVHAELNAILYSPSKSLLKGARIFVTLFPCNNCAKAIIQSGIKEVVYLDAKSDTVEYKASKIMLATANIITTKFDQRPLFSQRNFIKEFNDFQFSFFRGIREN